MLDPETRAKFKALYDESEQRIAEADAARDELLRTVGRLVPVLVSKIREAERALRQLQHLALSHGADLASIPQDECNEGHR